MRWVVVATRISMVKIGLIIIVVIINTTCFEKPNHYTYVGISRRGSPSLLPNAGVEWDAGKREHRRRRVGSVCVKRESRESGEQVINE